MSELKIGQNLRPNGRIDSTKEVASFRKEIRLLSSGKNPKIDPQVAKNMLAELTKGRLSAESVEILKSVSTNPYIQSELKNIKGDLIISRDVLAKNKNIRDGIGNKGILGSLDELDIFNTDKNVDTTQ